MAEPKWGDGQFAISWIDYGREPTQPPDPKYPLGVDLDISKGARSCKVALPYPAPRIGVFSVRCKRCGFTCAATTAGRPDDPRSITMPCKFDA